MRFVLALAVLGTVSFTTQLPPQATAAAPAVGEHVLSPLYGVAIGDDPLAPLALEAVESWHVYLVTGIPTYLARHLELRDELAAAAATRLGIDPVRLQHTWAVAPQTNMLVLLTAMTQLGVSYRTDTSEPGRGFDCSGLTMWAWSFGGAALTRSSGDQIREAASRAPEEAQPGDLIQYPGHISLYLGIDRAVIHSPEPGRGVEFATVTDRNGRRVRFGHPLG